MKHLFLTLCAALAPLGGACAAQDAAAPAPEPAPAAPVTGAVRDALLANIRQQVACVRELRDTLAMVQDKAGAEAAAPKAREIVERLVQLQEESRSTAVEADDALLQEGLKIMEEEPAMESFPVIATMLNDNDYYGSTALREALAPILADSAVQG